MKKHVADVTGSRGKRPQQQPLPDHDDSFETFLEGWLVRQEHLLDELLSVKLTCNESSNDEHIRDLIARVLSHYHQYYEHKSIAAKRDVFRLFAPAYFSSLEQSFLWIAGFKPGLALKLASFIVDDLSEDQKLRLRKLIDETRAEERGLTEDLAKIQESVAASPMVEMLRSFGMCYDTTSVVVEEDEGMEKVRAGLESVVGNADSLRLATAVKVAEILSPVQNVKFFTAVTQLQVNVRLWGNHRDAEQHWKADGFY